jgi:hypothetical protein
VYLSDCSYVYCICKPAIVCICKRLPLRSFMRADWCVVVKLYGCSTAGLFIETAAVRICKSVAMLLLKVCSLFARGQLSLFLKVRCCREFARMQISLFLKVFSCGNVFARVQLCLCSRVAVAFV